MTVKAGASLLLYLQLWHLRYSASMLPQFTFYELLSLLIELDVEDKLSLSLVWQWSSLQHCSTGSISPARSRVLYIRRGAVLQRRRHSVRNHAIP